MIINKSEHNLFFLLALTVLVISGCEKRQHNESGTGTVVIIDSDMVESFDDGIAFMMLLGSDNIDIKGLTTVTTNVWAQEGLAHGIRLGELCGGHDVEYMAGAQYPMRPGRLDTIDDEIDSAPGQDASWRGAVSYPEVTDWESYYMERYGRQPEIRPSGQDASEFIAQHILGSPGKVTILAIGACTNVAKAIIAHPEIPEKAREIIYMGGAVFCPGNTTTYAEMNFLYDPEAAAICLRAPFPKQTIVSLDVCNTVGMDRDRFMEIYDSIRSEEVKSLVRSNFPYPEFTDDPSSIQLVWDLISAAIAVNPDIITEYKESRLDVDDIPGSPTYGKSYETDLESRQKILIPLKIDQKKFWDIVRSGLNQSSGR